MKLFVVHRYLACLFLNLVISYTSLYAQALLPEFLKSRKVEPDSILIYFKNLSQDSVEWIPYRFVPCNFPARVGFDNSVSVQYQSATISKHLMQIHGSVYYEFLYRSRLDTPYVAKNMQQHTEQIGLDIIFKDKYPLRIYINSRQSNLSYFKNFVDLNFRFNTYDYASYLKRGIVEKLTAMYRVANEIHSIEQQKSVVIGQYDSLLNWIRDSRRLEEISIERELRLPVFQQLINEKQLEEKLIRKLMLDSCSRPVEYMAQIDSFRRIESPRSKERLNIDSVHNTSLHLADSSAQEMRQSTVGKASKYNSILSKTNSLIQQFQGMKNKGTLLTDSVRRMAPSITTRESLINGNLIVDSIQRSIFRKDSLLQVLKTEPTYTQQRLLVTQHRLDSLQNVISKLKEKFDNLQSFHNHNLAYLTDRIYGAKSVTELQFLLKEHNSELLSKKDALLMSISQLGVGRSLVSYSELTVKNISLTGLNIEYRNNTYAALAVGTVDYRFRDFIFDPSQRIKQKLLLARYGIAPSAEKSLIFTAYTGDRQNYTGTSVPGQNNTRIVGYGLEGSYRLNPNLDATLEVVKSSIPYGGANRSEAINKAFLFSEHSNEALFLKVNSAFPSLHSFFTAYYRKTGVNFQSYSVFNSGSRQEAWGIKWQQYLFKKQVILNSQLRKNEFDNPLLSRNYNTQAIVKSIQLLVRKKKWPMVSIGYMPTTQLTRGGDGIVTENLFYTLTSTAAYSYRTRETLMNTTLVFSKFNTRSTDTGFVFFGAKNINATQTIQLHPCVLRSMIDWYAQPGLAYYTLSQNVEFRLSNIVSFDVGAKYALTNYHNRYYGGMGECRINSGMIGMLQMRFERGFLPDYSRMGLIPNNWGSVSWYKTF